MKLYATGPLKATFAKLVFSQSVRLDLYDTLSAYIRDGVDLYTILTKVGNEYRVTGPFDVRDTVLLEWAAAMDRGSLSFSSAIAPWIPASEVMLLQSGEESGDLPGAFDSAIFSASAVQEMKNTVVKAITLPLILLAMVVGLFIGADKFILPAFAEVAPPSSWPQGSQTFYWVAYWISSSLLSILAAFAATIALLAWLLPNFARPARDIIDRAPPFSVYRSLQSATFLVSLSAQMRCGVPLSDAIDNLREVASPYVAYRLHQISIRLGLSGNPGRALDTGFLDLETGIKVRLLSETSSLDRAMDSIGKSSISESLNSISRKSKLANGLIGVLVAASLIWMSLSTQAISQSLTKAAGAGL